VNYLAVLAFTIALGTSYLRGYTPLLVWLHPDQGSIHLNTGLFKVEEIIVDMVPDSSLRIVLLRLLSGSNPTPPH
jgi:hypothetical protein